MKALKRVDRVRAKVRGGFTLIELLVVIAIIAILAALLLPVLAGAKTNAKTVQCASNMKQWAAATIMYVDDNGNTLPYSQNTGSQGNVSDLVTVFQYLAPYVAKQTQANLTDYNSAAITTAQIRQCPGASQGEPPFTTEPILSGWNCWIGINLGEPTDKGTLTSPFYPGDIGVPPLKVSRIHHPADALTFMDSFDWYIYSPVYDPFTEDVDHDGLLDSCACDTGVPYNDARPTVHGSRDGSLANGANVTLLDGHVVLVPFKVLWRCNPNNGSPLNQYWTEFLGE